MAAIRKALRAAIVGVGTTQYGRLPEHDDVTLGLWALREALADCGLQAADIDGLILHRIPDDQRFCRASGLNPRYFETMPAQGRMTGIAIQHAALALATGAASCIALVYGNNGRTAGERYGGAGDRYGSGADQFWFPYGMTSPGAVHALLFQRYMHEYGVRAESLAPISVAFRRHATRNPNAVLRTPITEADHQASRFICAPLRLFDYCLINDGGVAMIMTTVKRARDMRQKPVYLRGFAQSSRQAQDDFPDDYGRACMRIAAEAALSMADARREDMSGLMIYDNFTPTVVFCVEGFGYCAAGEGAHFVAGGRFDLDGQFPTNTNGGHLSESYMQGWGLNVEAVRQLRGACGERQIRNASLIQYMAAAPITTTLIYGVDP